MISSHLKQHPGRWGDGHFLPFRIDRQFPYLFAPFPNTYPNW